MAVEPSRPGKRKCMKCGKEFLSPDAERIRRCPKCKKGEDDYIPTTVRLDDAHRNIREYGG